MSDNIFKVIESFVNSIIQKNVVKNISKNNNIINKLYYEMNKTRDVVNSTTMGLGSTISNTNTNFNLLLSELKRTREELEVLKNEFKVLKTESTDAIEESNYKASVALEDSSICLQLVSKNLHGKRPMEYVEDEQLCKKIRF